MSTDQASTSSGTEPDATIFVALAAYREPELHLTIDDCIAKATNPERLRFGICLQYDKNGPAEIQKNCIDDLLDDPRFKVLKYDYRNGKGGCWARHLAQTLYRWERYTLQVDAHTRFVNNWDTVLIDMLHRLPGEKPIITGFPPFYWRDNGRDILEHADELSKVGTTVIEHWEAEGDISRPTRYIAKNKKIPRRTRVLSGAFVFTFGFWNQQVTQDPQSLYFGEEFALTLRSFTSGFDLFNPTQIVVWHRNHPEPNPKYITDFPSDIVQERHRQAMGRLQLLMEGDPLGKLGVFSLGRTRSLYDYYIFSGLDCRNRSIHPDARNGVPPDPVTIRDKQVDLNTEEPRVAGNKVLRSFHELARFYSKTIDDFFFVQVGANDGRTGDPLYCLVTELNWCGVFVEPQKPVYERLIANYAGRKNLSFENVAIDGTDGQRELYRFSFSEERWATGLASFDKSHLELHIDNGYVERMMGEARNQLPENKADYISSDIVTTMTFDTLLDKYQIKRIDLLQIDTEGYDYDLLQMYDFDRLVPAIVQFEHHVMTDEQRSASVNLLHNHGYVTFTEGINMVAFQQKLAEQLGLSFTEG